MPAPRLTKPHAWASPPCPSRPSRRWSPSALASPPAPTEARRPSLGQSKCSHRVRWANATPSAPTGVLRTLARAARGALEANPQVTRLALTVAVQGFRDVSGISVSTVERLSELFGHASDSPRGLANYLLNAVEAPEKVLVSNSAGPRPFRLSAGSLRLGGRSAPVLHVMAEGYPAGELTLDYRVRLTPVMRQPRSVGPPVPARVAIREQQGDAQLRGAVEEVFA